MAHKRYGGNVDPNKSPMPKKGGSKATATVQSTGNTYPVGGAHPNFGPSGPGRGAKK